MNKLKEFFLINQKNKEISHTKFFSVIANKTDKELYNIEQMLIGSYDPPCNCKLSAEVKKITGIFK